MYKLVYSFCDFRKPNTDLRSCVATEAEYNKIIENYSDTTNNYYIFEKIYKEYGRKINVCSLGPPETLSTISIHGLIQQDSLENIYKKFMIFLLG